MLGEQGSLLPHAWVTGDDEMGRPYGFRRDLNDLDEQDLWEVPSHTLVRDQEIEASSDRGHGRRPMAPFGRVSKWRESLPQDAWTRIEVRDGQKGPIVVEIVKRRVSARTETGGTAPAETLVIIRSDDETGTPKHDYYFSNAPSETPLKEFARVASAHRRIEQCIQRAKSEAGLAEYQVRTWQGWHHHVTLSLIATWFLVQEARRGKNTTPAITVPQVRQALASLLHRASRCDTHERIAKEQTRRLERNELARFYHHKRLKRLPKRQFNQRK